jgi:hypothetical protein
MVRLPCAVQGTGGHEKKKLTEEGDEKNEQFSNTKIRRGMKSLGIKLRYRGMGGEVAKWWRKGRNGTYMYSRKQRNGGKRKSRIGK